MHITSIEIANFRRFEQYECTFDPRFTLLIGPNGAGKTSLLRAVFAGVWGLLHRFGQADIREDDVRRVDSIDPGGSRWRTPAYPSVIQVHLDIDGKKVDLTSERTSSQSAPYAISAEINGPSHAGLQAMQRHLERWLDPAYRDPAPLFARFGASSSLVGSSRPGALQQPFERKQQIWERSLTDVVNVTEIAQWFQYNELRTLQEGQAPVAYRVARQAVLDAIHADDVKYVVRDNQLMVLHGDVGWRPFDQLSDGQRRVAAIFCDLALRCAALNSHLGERCIADTTGVVCIDEIDLHLHPLWQRSIVGDLRRVFPNLQFIAASHSPFLLQAAYEHGRVLDVSTGEFAEPTDRSIEDIAESVMGVDHPQRGQRFLELKRRAQAFYELLEQQPTNQEEAAALKQQLDLALADFADDPAAAAWLEQRRVAAGH